MIFKKSVVLSSLDNTIKKAVITFDNRKGSIAGSVKLYNFVEEPIGILSLAILVDGKVLKAGLTRDNYMSYQFASEISDLPQNSACAIIGTQGGNVQTMLMGSIENGETLETRLASSLAENILETKSVEKITDILNQNNIAFDDQKEIEQEIDDYFMAEEKQFGSELEFDFTDVKPIEKNIPLACTGNCENCTYKDVFFQRPSLLENTKKFEAEDAFEIKTSLKAEVPEQPKEFTNIQAKSPQIRKRIANASKISNTLNFYDEISSQLGLLFEKYPADEILSGIIPNSKWAKVSHNNKEGYYVVGLIYVNDKVKYVCYGVPAKFTVSPPADFNQNAQWLPLDIDQPNGKGYWLTYQDAFDGEMVKVDII